MHEFALVKGLLETVLEQAEVHGIKKINRVKIVVGEMTAALPESLQFSFEILSQDTPAEGAELVIENRALQLECQECKHSFKPKQLKYSCPECESTLTEIIIGRELFVDYFEGD
ncbi:MAG: hydrogenase maturation nickel metallochaperone HypA [Candidatus Syntrophonatronum acetioxidans]|uniref:Hydrogenase maturation factor HypA n=1 Tax=Candidatus Syntrophonatronum acetioxidans TaxID=1795816 RepID=A0A424YDI6_9FIRM|nr:MAG: hydrogenase maturation nickel metallochaperone HypA [Candidatus Syntrophonatronum acetioxidans]